LLPDVPTLQERGVALSTSIFQAVFAPARTPAPVVALLSEAVAQALRTPQAVEILRGQASLPEPTSPTGLLALVREERETWGRIIRSADIRLD
jgi:tripartite-type tricarboxylate transporter receptor subunit TctC